MQNEISDQPVSDGMVDRLTEVVSLTFKYVHSIGKLEMLGGLTDAALVDRLTGRQVDRTTN